MDPNIPNPIPAAPPIQTPVPEILTPEVTIETTPPVPQPTVAPVNQDPPKPKSKVLFLSLTILLILVVLGISGFWIYQKFTTPSQPQPTIEAITPSPTATADPTADWKTYLNTSAKYTIKYPANWEVINYGLMDAKPADEITKYVRLNYQPDISKSGVGFNIEETPTINLSQNIKFNEERNFGIELAKCGTADDGTITFCWLKIINQSKYLVFTISNYDNVDNNKTINQILSTFKFTDQTTDVTADWNTYNNTKYGFSFNYPSGIFFDGKPDSDSIYLDDDKNTVLPYGGDSQPVDLMIQIIKYEKNENLAKKKQDSVKVLDLSTITTPDLLDVNPSLINSFWVSGKGESESPIQDSTWDFIGIQIPNTDVYISISFSKNYGLDDKTFKQILSTFKFTQ